MHKVTDLLSDIPLFSSFPCTVLFLFPDSDGNFRYPGPLPILATPPGPPAPPGTAAPPGSPLSPPPTPPHPPAEQLASAPPEPPRPPSNPPHPPAEHPLTTPAPASPAPRSLAASPEAARALFDLLPMIERILRRHGVPDRDIPDVAQTVLVQALPWWTTRTPAEHRSTTGPCRAYVAAVARRAACNRHRTAARRREDIGFTTDWLEQQQENNRSPPSFPTAPSAEDLWLEHEEAAERAAEVDLDRLGRMTSPSFWRVFYAHIVAGTPVFQIVEAEQVPLGTIYQRLRLARRDLRAAILRFRAARSRR